LLGAGNVLEQLVRPGGAGPVFLHGVAGEL
jgi:hypothetical protein